MITEKNRRFKAFTLIEVIIAIVIVAIIAIGALSYHLYSVQHMRKARAVLAATRITRLLVEDWKSTGGSPNYDPRELDMLFTSSPNGGGISTDYQVTVDTFDFYVDLDTEDIDEDETSGTKLRKLSATVYWRNDYKNGPVSADDPRVLFVTYVRADS